MQQLPEDWTKQQIQPSKYMDKQETGNALPRKQRHLALQLLDRIFVAKELDLVHRILFNTAWQQCTVTGFWQNLQLTE